MEGDARLINDADGDDENQICHLYLMRGVMNSLFARRNAENANWEMDILDAAHRSPLLSSPLLLPPSNFSTPYFSRFSTSRPFVTRSSWHETSPNEISQKTKRNILMDRRRQFSRRSCIGVGRYCREVCWVWNTRLKEQDFHCIRYKFPAYREHKGRVRAILRRS